jgi:hypothetical protein
VAGALPIIVTIGMRAGRAFVIGRTLRLRIAGSMAAFRMRGPCGMRAAFGRVRRARSGMRRASGRMRRALNMGGPFALFCCWLGMRLRMGLRREAHWPGQGRNPSGRRTRRGG